VLNVWWRALALAASLGAGGALADPPHARAAAEAADRTFRDWRLACADAGCAIRSAVHGADGSEVLSVAATRGGADAGLAFRTPLPLLLPDGLTLTLGDAPARVLPWRTCDAAGCSAESTLEPDLLAGLRRERTAEATLTLLDGVRVRLPVSLLGFSAAWEALESAAAVSPP
jgi:invasion protein IalB